MPQIKFIEKRIWDIEGFDVTILNPDGSDVRSDKNCPVQYDYQRASKNSHTVSEWISSRFESRFVNYKVKVLKADGTQATGQTRISNVRDTYLEE